MTCQLKKIMLFINYMNSKLIKAFNWIFTFLLVVSIIPFFTYQGDMQFLVLIVMLVAIVASTISYIPYNKKGDEEIAYLTSYISHLVIIVVMFLLALWELNNIGFINVWFYVLLLTVALARPVIYLLIKAFKK